MKFQAKTQAWSLFVRHQFPVQLRVEADHELVSKTIRRRPQVAAGSDHMLQDRLPVVNPGIPFPDRFSFGRGNGRRPLKQMPCPLGVISLLARINHLKDGYLVSLKNLLSIMT